MNIEQLNGSGQHVWVFVATAAIALAVTMSSWFMIEQVNSYRKWSRRTNDQPYDGRTKFALVVRLAMLSYLLINHKHWTFESGAWWRIMINDRSEMFFEMSTGYAPAIFEPPLNAGEYVSKFSKGYNNIQMHLERYGSRPFGARPISWKRYRRPETQNIVRDAADPSRPLSEIL